METLKALLFSSDKDLLRDVRGGLIDIHTRMALDEFQLRLDEAATKEEAVGPIVEVRYDLIIGTPDLLDIVCVDFVRGKKIPADFILLVRGGDSVPADERFYATVAVPEQGDFGELYAILRGYFLKTRFDAYRLEAESMKGDFYRLVRVIGRLVDLIDPYNQRHSERVAFYSEAISRYLHLTDQQRRRIWMCSFLRDLGQLVISEDILNKPCVLSVAEKRHIQSHPNIGADLLKEFGFEEPTWGIVRHHHERYDGLTQGVNPQGYPDGLVGEDIPIESRVIFVADTFNALTTERGFRKALSAENAYKVILGERGRQFDPDVVDAFERAYRAGNLTIPHR
jgi:HD-GYP domain-containing protein (c-di-GMP phosphodiesterase class II)